MNARIAPARVCLLIGFALLLSDCAGADATLSLGTRINALGGGKHEMILALPRAIYRTGMLDRLPDFSLLTGVRVEDYDGVEGQGIYVSQSFMRLSRLNGPPEKAIFLNRVFPGQPLAYRAAWEPGLFTRRLGVHIFVNAFDGRSLGDLLSNVALSAVTARYELLMPAAITRHNGIRVDERTVQWIVPLGQHRVLEATAEVPNYPAWVALLFSSAGVLYGVTEVFVVLRSGSIHNGRTRPRPRRPGGRDRQRIPRPPRRY